MCQFSRPDWLEKGERASPRHYQPSQLHTMTPPLLQLIIFWAQPPHHPPFDMMLYNLSVLLIYTVRSSLFMTYYDWTLWRLLFDRLANQASSERPCWWYKPLLPSTSTTYTIHLVHQNYMHTYPMWICDQ